MEDTTSEKDTFQAIKTIEDALYDMDAKVYEETGESVLKHSFVAMTAKNAAVMVIELTKGESREIDGFEVTKRWRENIPPISGIKEFDIRSTSNESDPITFKITSNDFEKLSSVTQIKNKLKTIKAYTMWMIIFQPATRDQLKLLPGDI